MWREHGLTNARIMEKLLISLTRIGNESVPKIIISNTTQQIYFLELQSAFWKFQIITVSESCLIKLLQYILFEKYSYILALEMASPANQHCANCIGTLSFPILISVMNHFRAVLLPRTFRQCTAQTSTSSQSTDGWIIIIIIIAMTMFMVLSSWPKSLREFTRFIWWM